VYFGDGTQMLDFRTLQDHDAPYTRSDLLFKGAVEDEARSVYSGLVRLRKPAQKSNAFQTNRNLVLTEGASAESIPNLEIEANDVRCSHASTVGPIDDDQLYYLESRGIAPAEAERLIVLGFFDDVFHRLPLTSLTRRLRAAVVDKLERRGRHG
jgi:Fe-S cluster assembly protein SufD